MNTSKICSGPYATDDIASEDSIASAFFFPGFYSPNSVDFKGRPIKNRLSADNMSALPEMFCNSIV
jgi:hypothetical protein